MSQRWRPAHWSGARWWGGALLLAAATLAAAAEIDGAASQAGFSLQTRWGQTLQGRFPSVRGEVDALADGRRRVRLELATGDVEILGHPGYTRFTRGQGFFAAARWPQVEFLSDPYPPALLQHGGTLGGSLRIRGIARHTVFLIEPATCARPGRDCDVVASGRIRRSDFDMARWRAAISEDVAFALRIRLRPDGDT